MGGRTQPNSRSDESPWVLGARGIPLCLSPSSFSLPHCLSLSPPVSRTTLSLFSHLNPSHPPFLLSRAATDLSFPRFPLSLGGYHLPPRHPPVTYRRRRRATTVATTPASPTLPNGIVLPLPLRNFQPARSPAATGRDCWAFPSRSRSLSTRIPHIPVCFVLSLHRATGIYLATFCSHLCPFPSLIGFSPSSLFLALALRTLFPSFSFFPTYPMVSNGLNFVEVSSG